MSIWSFVWPNPTCLANYLGKLQTVEEDCTVWMWISSYKEWVDAMIINEKLRWLKVWYVSVFVYLNTFIVLFVWLCVFAYLYLPVRNIEMFCDNRINPRNCPPAVSLYKERSPLKKVLANKNLLLTYLFVVHFSIEPTSQCVYFRTIVK